MSDHDTPDVPPTPTPTRPTTPATSATPATLTTLTTPTTPGTAATPTTAGTPGMPATASTPADEASALALLDARGRRAAANLGTAVATLVAARPVPAEAPASTGLPGPPGRPSDAVPARGGGPTLGDTRGGRTRTWLVAAVFLVVVGLVAALLLVARTADDQDAIVSDDSPAYPVPGWIPDGWEVQEAQQLRVTDFPASWQGNVAVYGDPTLDDPWVGPRLAVLQMAEDVVGEEPSGEQAIEVGGRPAAITEEPDGVSVRIRLDGRVLEVSGHDVGRETVLSVAEAAMAGDATPALPDRFSGLASGPLSAAGIAGGFAADGLALFYGGTTSATQLGLLQRIGDRDDAELVRLLGPGVQAAEVRGQPAYLVDDYMLQWYEPSAGMLLTVVGEGQDSEALRRFAEGLRPARPGEVDDLLRAHGRSGPFGRLQEGEVLVAEGEYANGDPWQVVASDDGSAAFGLSFSDSAGGTGIVVPEDGVWGLLYVDVAAHGGSGGRDVVAVYGTVGPEAVAVAAEAPGRPPMPLTVHVVEGIDGWDERVFVGMVPVDMGPAQLVARDAAGAEVAREPLDPSTDGGTSGGPDQGGSEGSTESCVALPEGGEECTAGSSRPAVGDT